MVLTTETHRPSNGCAMRKGVYEKGEGGSIVGVSVKATTETRSPSRGGDNIIYYKNLNQKGSLLED
jgi:hypothetical protein